MIEADEKEAHKDGGNWKKIKISIKKISCYMKDVSEYEKKHYFYSDF